MTWPRQDFWITCSVPKAGSYMQVIDTLPPNDQRGPVLYLQEVDADGTPGLIWVCKSELVYEVAPEQQQMQPAAAAASATSTSPADQMDDR